MSTPGRYLLALLLVVVLGQRLAIPLGGDQVPANLPLALGVLALGLLTGHLRFDAMLTRLYAVSVGSLVVLTLVALARGLPLSLLSLGFIVALYVLWAVRTPALSPADQGRLLDGFVRVMVVLAVVGLVQAASQYAGVPYQDWLARVVPGPFLLEGYNTGDRITWDNPIHRTNGLLFLEPSFFSFFLGLAVVMALHRRRSLATVAVLLLAILPTVAGNGAVVLGAGVVVLALRGRWRDLRPLLPPAGAALVVIATVPGATRLITRVTEVGAEGSSAHLRMVEPYVQLLPVWSRDPAAVLLGNGPGTATTYLDALGTAGLLAPVVPKLMYEYGIVGTILFLVFVVTALASGSRMTPWTPGVLLAYFVVNAALQQSTFALVTVLLVRLIQGGGADVVPPRPGQAADRDQGLSSARAAADRVDDERVKSAAR